MPLNRQHITRGANVLLRVGVLGVGLSVSWPIAATVFVGVGGSLISELVSRGLQQSCSRLGQGHEVVNGDLQRALERAYLRSINCLDDLWWKTQRGNQIRRTDEVRKAECEGVFTLLRQNADSLMTAAQLRELGNDTKALALLGQGRVGAQTALRAYLDQILFGHDQELDRLIRTSLEPQIEACFAEELKTESREGNRAWRAYQRLVLDAMVAGVTSLNQKQDQILVKLESWEQRWNETKTDAREPTGEAGLQLLVDRAAERIISALAEQFAQTEEVTEAWFQATWTLFGTELRGTEDRIVDRVLQGIDERLEAQSRAAPPIRSLIWDVPHHWSRFFVGRDTLLARIRDQFTSHDYPVALVQAIQGLGGVGKTQVAVHYAYCFSGEYAGVWWLPAESESTLLARYAALADRLGIASSGSHDYQERIAAVRNYLEGTQETGERWLLIFDNAVPSFTPNGNDDALVDYLPRRGACDVLITSREKAWRHRVVEQNVEVLGEMDAVRFLLERTGEADDRAARELAGELGYLPLALEQAGAYIDESRGQHTLESYLSLFRRRPLERLASDRAKVGEYNEVVATTWFISFEAIERQSSAAGDLLRLIAHLAPERIPLGDLIAHAEVLPPGLAMTLREPEAGPHAVSLLLRYSLAEAAGSGLLNVHRLVQLVVREWMTDEEFEIWSMAALAIIDAAFPTHVDDPQEWEVCAKLVPHAYACVQHVSQSVGETASIGRLLTKTGMYFQRRALHMQAKVDLEWALNIVEVDPTFEVSDLASSRNNLAGVLRSLGDLPGARKLLDRARLLLEAEGEQNTPVMATTLNDLGNLMRAQGDSYGAQEFLERSLAVHEQVFGANHPRVATALANLANAFRYQDRPARARPLLERALEIDEMAYGPHHPEVATDLANLGSVLRAEEKLVDARRMFERALAIDKAVYENDHPNVAIHLAGLAGVAQAEYGLEEAELLLRQALRINEAFYSANHSEVATSLNHLAGVLRARENFEEATNLLARVLRIAKLTLEPGHPALSLAYWNLAVVVEDQGDLTRAESLFAQAAKSRDDAVG